MVVQYPHILKLTALAVSTQDGDGNFSPGGETETEYSCRYEPETGSVMIQSLGGTQIAVTGTVYLPLPGINIVAPGTRVQILDGAKVLSNETVKRHSVGQLNQRVWL